MGNPQRVSKRHLKRKTPARLHMGVHRDCPHECCYQTPPHAARRIDLHRRAVANFSARTATNSTGINPITQPTRPLRGLTNRDLDFDMELDQLLSASRPVTASPLQVPGSGSGSGSGTGTPAAAAGSGGPFRFGLRPAGTRNASTVAPPPPPPVPAGANAGGIRTWPPGWDEFDDPPLPFLPPFPPATTGPGAGTGIDTHNFLSDFLYGDLPPPPPAAPMPPPPHLPPMLAGPPAYPTLPRRRDASVSPPLRRRNAMYVARDRDRDFPPLSPLESVHLPLPSLSTTATPVPGSTILPANPSTSVGPVASAVRRSFESHGSSDPLMTSQRAPWFARSLGARLASTTPTPPPPPPPRAPAPAGANSSVHVAGTLGVPADILASLRQLAGDDRIAAAAAAMTSSTWGPTSPPPMPAEAGVEHSTIIAPPPPAARGPRADRTDRDRPAFGSSGPRRGGPVSLAELRDLRARLRTPTSRLVNEVAATARSRRHAADLVPVDSDSDEEEDEMGGEGEVPLMHRWLGDDELSDMEDEDDDDEDEDEDDLVMSAGWQLLMRPRPSEGGGAQGRPVRTMSNATTVLLSESDQEHDA
ncbi:hypothetical protein GGF31_008921 [Allomyces arbusculus]|nr:hypothetical protein GGF31_008921 [Allomyces arbusculus]